MKLKMIILSIILLTSFVVFCDNTNHQNMIDIGIENRFAKSSTNMALYFDGSDKVLVSSSNSLNPTSAITMMAWVKADNWDGNSRIFEKVGAAGGQYRLIDEGNFELNIEHLGTIVEYSVPSTGVWHHVAGTFDGSQAKLYYDGDLVASGSASGSIPARDVTLGIGGNPNSDFSGDFFTGYIDETRIYNRALSETEIENIKDNNNPTSNGLVLYYSFDVLAGTTCIDLSPYGNNGTNYGADHVQSFSWPDSNPPTIDHPADLQFEEGMNGNSIVWSPTDDYPNSFTIFQNDVSIDSGNWDGTQIVYDVDSLTSGTYNFTCLVTDDSGLSNSDTVMVYIDIPNIPSVDDHTDIQYENGTTDNYFYWITSDDYPDNYEIYRNDTLVKSAAWGGGNIVYYTDYLASGIYNFTIIVYDQVGQQNSDYAFAYVEPKESPMIDSPNDITYEYDSTGHTIEWQPSDITPDSYQIYRNGTLIDSDSWDGTSITIDIDGLALGTYNFSLIVFDGLSQSTSDMVLVFVEDTTSPTIDSPTDYSYEAGSTNNWINWTVGDNYPDTYELYRDGSVIDSGPWNGNKLNCSVDGLDPNAYNFTLVIFDSSGNSNSDEVWITVEDTTSPTIDSPTDYSYEAGSTNNWINWTCSDFYPQRYEIYHNGSLVDSGIWNNESISINVDGLQLAIHNFTLFLEDQYDNQNTSSTWITVMDTINPEINDVTDMIYSEGNQSVFVEWVPVDENPFYYKIFLNNSLLQSGIWNTSYEVITQQLGGLSYGLYNTTIIVFDEVNNSNKDMLWIHVIDTISPQLDSPEDILYPEGDTGYSIHWTAQDTNPSEYYILCNDTVLQEGTWNETYEVISIIADGHPYGLYEYNLTVVDIDGNSFSDIVLVNVFDGNLPTILPVSDIYKGELDETTNLTWNPIDLHPKNYTIFLNDTIIRQGNWNETTEEIIVNLSNHELGCYNYTLRIFDIDDNSAVSDILVFVNDLTSPEINHLDSYHMVETTEGHYIEWQGSDLHPNKYTIFLNGSIVIDQAWNSSSELLRYSIDTLSRGTYNVTIILTDIGMNRVKDQLFIYVNDETAPMIEKSSNCQISEGTEGIVISWNVSDLHLYTYKLYRNTTVIAENFFNSTYETITVSLNGLQLGRWNFTLLSYDLDLNSKASNILVEVFDGTPPEILGPNNQKVAISSFPAILSWEPYDSHPTSYRITRNHTILTVGSWTSGTNISISLDNLEVGIYNLSIIIFDIGNNGAAHSVIITIYDDYIPILNSPDDQVFSEGEVPDIITWEISDNGLSHYQVLKNDSIIKSGVLGEFQDTVTIDPSTLESGTWNLTLVVHDRNGNVASDSVIVTITTSGAFTNNELVNLINTPIIGGSSIFIMLGIALLTLRKKKTKSQIHESSTSEYSPKKREIFVDIKRGGEFTGNRYKFKVKIENNSSNVITDVKVSLASYPKDALTAEGKMSREYAKIERGGFRTPTFEFLPKQDCVQGSIIANVTYIDSHGKPYSAVTEPLEIRAVCDLLRPESISPEDFMFKLAGLNHGEMMVRVEDWTPTEMLEKTGNILKDASFFQVSSEISNIGEYTEVRLQGWAKGIYTHKSLGVEVIITGKEGVKGATCVIKMIGEDDAMIMPAIDEIAKKIGAWLCPYCMGKLPSEMVNKLKEGISVGCPFCGVTIDY